MGLHLHKHQNVGNRVYIYTGSDMWSIVVKLTDFFMQANLGRVWKEVVFFCTTLWKQIVTTCVDISVVYEANCLLLVSKNLATLIVTLVWIYIPVVWLHSSSVRRCTVKILFVKSKWLKVIEVILWYFQRQLVKQASENLLHTTFLLTSGQSNIRQVDLRCVFEIKQ